jgi:hypothetical protein
MAPKEPKKPLESLWAPPTDPESERRKRVNDTYQKVVALREAPKKKDKKRSFADLVREATDDNRMQIEFFTALAAGEIEGSTIGDRIIANKVLLDRGQGRAPEVNINVSADSEELADVDSDTLRAAVRKAAK